MSAGGKCLMNLCIFDEIIIHIDGRTILHLAVTCKWVWDLLSRSRTSWRRALSNHEDFAPFPGAHLRTPRTLVVLHFSSDCVMCGLPTNNPILANHAVRLCDDCSAQHLIAMRTHTTWQSGPHPAVEQAFLPDIHDMPPTPSTAQLYPAEPAQMVPANFDKYSTPQLEPAEWMPTSIEATEFYPAEFYSHVYMNPIYSSSRDIDIGCGFPQDLSDDDEFEDFTGTHTPKDDSIDNHGPSTP
ncbi:unnamed protein product [Rhizoctonia solani]|uniref:Uncharacterized protein n=1 Tax=Rhizoctonia solani TaxID=456999 RepID=A0A8H3C9L0_9AGAM|nr:unnamed protein product [Rhizoctonia solani]